MIKTQGERRFSALIEKSADAILIVDAFGKITYTNPAVGELLGYASEVVVTMSIYDLVHPQERPSIERQFAEPAVATSQTGELRLKCYNGSWLWMEGTITNLLDDPEIEGIYLNLRDITGRKEAHYNLESQKDLLQNLVVVARATSEATELGEVLQNLLKIGKWLTLAISGSVFVIDEIGAVAYSRSYYSRLDPERVQFLMEKGLTNWVIQHRQPALVTDTLTDGRWVELAPNDYKPRSAVAIPIFSGQDVLAILVLTHSSPGHFNTGHLKTLEAASGQMAMAIHNARLYHEAQSNLADLNALIDSSRDGIVLVSLDGFVKVINAAALELVGLAINPADLINCPVVDLYRRVRPHAPELVKVMVAQNRQVRTGEITSEEGECRVGSHFVHWLYSPITIQSRIVGWLIVMRDVTERRRLQQQREELTDMIVHDLRNPASAISGIVAMLKSLKDMGGIPDDFDEMMQLAERNVNKILELVQEILDVRQLETGQLPMDKSAIDMERLIEDALQLQQPIVSLKGMTLTNQTTQGLPCAWGDVRLMRRVLQNLIDNAAKFSRRDGEIIVQARISADDPQMIQVCVQDFGVGIPAELQDHVFEKFVSARNAQRGSGIGLTFCRLAVLAHDGRIWAESEENRGSTFYFTLPIADKC